MSYENWLIRQYEQGRKTLFGIYRGFAVQASWTEAAMFVARRVLGLDVNNAEVRQNIIYPMSERRHELSFNMFLEENNLV
jgi:hypothetical protein